MISQKSLLSPTLKAGAPTDANKLNRVEAQSPTNTQTSQPTQPQQTQQSTAQHGQTQYINPHSIPPGYAAPSYYYQMPPGAAGYTAYGAPMIPLNNLVSVTYSYMIGFL